MEQVMELCHFVKSTTQQYWPRIKDQSGEGLLQSILTLNTEISKNGLKLENLKVTSTDKVSIYINALWSAISSCENLKTEIRKHGENGENFYKSEKQLENLISYLRVILIKITLKHIRTMV